MGTYKGYQLMWPALGGIHPFKSHAAQDIHSRRSICGLTIPNSGDDGAVPDGSLECKSCKRIVDRFKPSFEWYFTEQGVVKVEVQGQVRRQVYPKPYQGIAL